jgi:hypothetical protein
VRGARYGTRQRNGSSRVRKPGHSVTRCECRPRAGRSTSGAATRRKIAVEGTRARLASAGRVHRFPRGSRAAQSATTRGAREHRLSRVAPVSRPIRAKATRCARIVGRGHRGDARRAASRKSADTSDVVIIHPPLRYAVLGGAERGGAIRTAREIDARKVVSAAADPWWTERARDARAALGRLSGLYHPTEGYVAERPRASRGLSSGRRHRKSGRGHRRSTEDFDVSRGQTGMAIASPFNTLP